VQYHLGVVYDAIGQTAQAREQFQKALRLNPNEELTTRINAAQQKSKAANAVKAD
jgi:Flp pilus assembly protein TadD